MKTEDTEIVTIADICASCKLHFTVILSPKTVCTTARTLTFLRQASSAAVKSFESIVNLYSNQHFKHTVTCITDSTTKWAQTSRFF